MKYLVFCPCGHGLDRHGAAGCESDGRAPCRCLNSSEAALEAAIDRARNPGWESVLPLAASEAERV